MFKRKKVEIVTPKPGPSRHLPDVLYVRYGQGGWPHCFKREREYDRYGYFAIIPANDELVRQFSVQAYESKAKALSDASPGDLVVTYSPSGQLKIEKLQLCECGCKNG